VVKLLTRFAHMHGESPLLVFNFSSHQKIYDEQCLLIKKYDEQKFVAYNGKIKSAVLHCVICRGSSSEILSFRTMAGRGTREKSSECSPKYQ
jgi:hypothetical protein